MSNRINFQSMRDMTSQNNGRARANGIRSNTFRLGEDSPDVDAQRLIRSLHIVLLLRDAYADLHYHKSSLP
jgi:hypothetical protein